MATPHPKSERYNNARLLLEEEELVAAAGETI
jgi:hypothetical protein